MTNYKYPTNQIYQHIKFPIIGILTLIDGFKYLRLECDNFMPFTESNWCYVGKL